MNSQHRDGWLIERENDPATVAREYLENSYSELFSTPQRSQQTTRRDVVKPNYLFSFLINDSPPPINTVAPKRPNTIKLSDVIFSKTPGILLETKKISVVEKYITDIDAVPAKYQSIETLFLSNNCLSTLRGIGQFKDLRILSIANNSLTDFSELDHLKDQGQLRILNLEFNPITQLPYYRYHVISRLPQIRVLDNKDVTSAEAKRCDIVLKKEETFLKLLFHNECIAARLATGLNNIKKDVSGRIEIIRRFRDKKKKNIFDVWNMYDIYTADDKDYVYQLIRSEVKRIYNIRLFGGGSIKDPSSVGMQKKAQTNNSASTDQWEISYNEALLTQQKRLAKLLYQLEIENERTIKMMTESDSILDQLLELEVPNRDELVYEFKNTMRALIDEFRDKYTGHQTLSKHSHLDYGIDTKRQFEPITKEMLDTPMKLSPTNAGPAKSGSSRTPSASHMASFATTLVHSLPPKQNDPATPPKLMTSSSKPTSTSAINSKKSSRSTSNTKTRPTSSVGTTKAAVESENQKLNSQLEALKNNIQQRAKAESELQLINNQLKDKLESYRCQNQENVARAKEENTLLLSELQKLREKLESARSELEDKRQESEDLHRRVEDLTQEVQEKENLLSHYSKKHEFLDEELNSVRSSHRKLEDLLELAKSDILSVTHESEYIKNVASEYSKELKDLFATEAAMEKADNHFRLILMRKAFLVFRLECRKMKWNKASLARCKSKSDTRLAKTIFGRWRRHLVANKKYKAKQSKSNRELQRQCFVSLKIYCNREKHAHVVQDRQKRNLAIEFFQRWRSELKWVRHEDTLMEKAIHFMNRRLQKKTFEAWYLVIQMRQEELEQEALEMENEKNVVLMRRAFHSWQRYIYQVVYAAREKEAALQPYLSHKLVIRTFNSWRHRLKVSQERTQMLATADAFYQKNITAMLFVFWRKLSTEKQTKRLRTSQAIVHYERNHLLRKTFDALRSYTSEKRKSKLAFLTAYHYYFIQLRRKAFDSLFGYYKRKTQNANALAHADSVYKSLIFHRWRNHQRALIYDRYLNATANKLSRKFAKNQYVTYFAKWKRQYHQNKHFEAVFAQFQEKRDKVTKAMYFRVWSRLFTRRLQNTCSNLKEQVADYVSRLTGQKDQISNADMEKLSLVQQLHTLSSEVSQLRMMTRERDEQVASMHKTIEENMIVENSLRVEVEQLKDQLSDYESEVARLKKELINDSAIDLDSTVRGGKATLMDKMIEIQNAQYMVQNLNRLVEDKTKEMEKYQKQILVLEGTNQELQQKLNGSFDLSNSLRKLLDDKDKQHAIELEEVVEQKNREIRSYEEKMRDMARQIVLLQGQIQHKDETNRKIVYEMDLLQQVTEPQVQNIVPSADSRSTLPPSQQPKRIVQHAVVEEQETSDLGTDDEELRRELFNNHRHRPTPTSYYDKGYVKMPTATPFLQTPATPSYYNNTTNLSSSSASSTMSELDQEILKLQNEIMGRLSSRPTYM